MACNALGVFSGSARRASSTIDQASADLNITATTDRQEAIRGAGYVLTTFRQGGFEARHQDETIPLRHGVIGQETIGPGGFFFAMRTLPVVKALIEDIRRRRLTWSGRA